MAANGSRTPRFCLNTKNNIIVTTADEIGKNMARSLATNST